LLKRYLAGLNNWSRLVQNILLPPTCLVCQQAADNKIDLCSRCLAEMPVLENTCAVCGIALTVSASTCGRCLKKTPYYDKIITLYPYQALAKFLIHALKFNNQHCCARIMGTLMARHFNKPEHQPDAILSVPLHPKRQSQRGFNQAELISHYVHKKLNVPLVETYLRRVINTHDQASLSAAKRRQNIRHAFRYTGKTAPYFVAVIDDVVTTGSTANEVARTLKKAGVKRVEIWAFARA